MYTIAWKDQQVALTDFCEIVNQQAQGSGHPVSLNNVSVKEWGGQKLIVHELDKSVEPLVLGVMLEVKGMFIPCVIINEVQGLPSDYPEVQPIRV